MLNTFNVVKSFSRLTNKLYEERENYFQIINMGGGFPVSLIKIIIIRIIIINIKILSGSNVNLRKYFGLFVDLFQKTKKELKYLQHERVVWILVTSTLTISSTLDWETCDKTCTHLCERKPPSYLLRRWRHLRNKRRRS